MVRNFFLIITSFLFLLFNYSFGVLEVEAALVDIGSGGSLEINVLSAEDSQGLEVPKNEEISLRDVSGVGVKGKSRLYLEKQDGDVSLSVLTETGLKQLDITDYEGDIVEVEERPQVQRLRISTSDGRFYIKQGGFEVVTDYEIDIDPSDAAISIKTLSGKRFLSVLPRNAIESLLRTKAITYVNSGGIELKEEFGKDLSYYVEGERVLDFFGLYSYPVVVRSVVSAVTGEVVEMEKPLWLDLAVLFFG